MNSNQTSLNQNLHWLQSAPNAEISIPADLGHLPKVEAMVKKFLSQHGVRQEERYFIILAMNEALINIVQHTYQHEKGQIDVDVLIKKNKMIIRIRDYGSRKNPAEFKGRALTELKPYGLGLHLIRSFMDDVTFLTGHKTGTELILTKQLDAHS